jgi:hypothetical protein
MVEGLAQMHAEIKQAKLREEAAEREKELQTLTKEAANAAITETVPPMIEAVVQKIAAPLFARWYREMRERERKEKKKRKKKRKRNSSSSDAREIEDSDADGVESSDSESSGAEVKKVKKKQKCDKKEKGGKEADGQKSRRPRGRPRTMAANQK